MKNKGFIAILIFPFIALLSVLLIAIFFYRYNLSKSRDELTQTQPSLEAQQTLVEKDIEISVTKGEIKDTIDSPPTNSFLEIPIPTGEKITIERSLFPNTEGEPGLAVKSIQKADYSPKSTYIIYFADNGLDLYGLYFSPSTDTKNITFVELVEEGVFSPDEKYIAFTHRHADAGPAHLHLYDLETGKTYQYISKSSEYCNPGFINLSWSDSQNINAEYIGFKCPEGDFHQNPVASGEIKIPLSDIK